MAGKEKSAGRVLLIPKGVFTIGTNYTPLDFVAFGSNNYVCKKATDGTKTPVEDTASWQMLAAGFDSHNIAAEYSEKATYHAGDICISGGNLYKAKQDINAAEAFTAGHWEEITIGHELTAIEAGVATKAEASEVDTLKEKIGTTALTTTATDLSGAVNEVKTASDTNASAITQLNSDLAFISPLRKVLFADTTGKNIKDLLLNKHKLIQNQSDGIYIIYGGWAGYNFGYMLVQKSGGTIRSVYFDLDHIYQASCRNDLSDFKIKLLNMSEMQA